MARSKATETTTVFTIRAKLARIRAELNTFLLEREDAIDVVMTALVCQKTVLLIGPPGAAKSWQSTLLLRYIIDAKKFNWLMGKFTEPDEIFGPMDFEAYRKGKRCRVTTDKLPESHLAELDEIFKASTAAGNLLLQPINEKVFNNGDGPKPIPLLSAIFMSNEYPQDTTELAALFDRCLLRLEVGYLNEATNREKLMFELEDDPVLVAPKLTLAELKAAHIESKKMRWDKLVRAKAIEIVETLIHGRWDDTLKKKVGGGIRPSDRRLKAVPAIVNAYAYVCGCNEPKVEHLSILKHVLWPVPEHREATASVVDRIANPVGAILTDIRFRASSVFKGSGTPEEKERKLSEIRQELSVQDQEDVRVQKVDDYLAELIGQSSSKSLRV